MSGPFTSTDHDRSPSDLQTVPDPRSRRQPGLPEIAVGLAIWAVGVYLLSPQLRRLDLGSEVHGLILAGLAVIIGPAGLAAASALRIRSLPAFGLRGVRPRWLLIGVAVGVVTLVLKSLATAGAIVLSGDTSNSQSAYSQAAGGGLTFLILTTLFLGVLTPFGEEVLFRGVVATGLLRYGPIVGVVGSAVIFALFHGITPVAAGAFVIGLATGELYRRTRSVWPSVVVHIVVNLPAPALIVLFGIS